MSSTRGPSPDARPAESPADTRAAERRTPQQHRSRDTVERILVAADAEIGELGLSGASTTGIARRAGVSVGALYRFFADKAAIADALAEVYLRDAALVYAEVLEGVTSREQLGDVAHRLVDLAAAVQLSHPGYYRLTEESPPHRAESPAHQVREHLVEMFVGALRSVGVEDDEAALRRVVDLGIETVRHGLVQAPAEEPERAAVVAELRAMLTAYLVARLG